MTNEEITAAHNAYLRQLDAALPAAPPLGAAPGPGAIDPSSATAQAATAETSAETSAALLATTPAASSAASSAAPAPAPQLLRVETASALGIALAEELHLSPASPDALWMPLNHHTLEVRLAAKARMAEPATTNPSATSAAGAASGMATANTQTANTQPTTAIQNDSAARAEVFGDLLDQWLAGPVAAETPGDHESAASVTVPSRDADLVEQLVYRGFSPVGIVGLREAAKQSSAAPQRPPRPGWLVRQATPEDVDAIAHLDTQLLAHDARFGVVNDRADALPVLRAGLAQRIPLAPEWTWVLEVDGTVKGFMHMLPPSKAGFFGSQSSYGERAGFLISIFTSPEIRGGAGTLLVETAHAALAAVGAPASTLDYAVTNPVSPGFWARMGYRPLWTTWRRRPARFTL